METLIEKRSAEAFEQIMKVSSDIKNSYKLIDTSTAKYLVDTYYQVQKSRIITGNQIFWQSKTEEPCALLIFTHNNLRIIEKNLYNALSIYAKHQPIYQWLSTICGIGPVISAGLIANIDITKVNTAGQIWSYAGLVPGKDHLVKGQKSPYNKTLKTLCWKIGQSFVKVSNNPKDFYGKIYKERKKYEIELNTQGKYSDQAKIALSRLVKKTTDTYKANTAGMLSDGHIQRRSERYATKIFLSHLFTVWYEMANHKLPPKPFAIAILGHKDEILVPNWDEDLFVTLDPSPAKDETLIGDTSKTGPINLKDDED